MSDERTKPGFGFERLQEDRSKAPTKPRPASPGEVSHLHAALKETKRHMALWCIVFAALAFGAVGGMSLVNRSIFEEKTEDRFTRTEADSRAEADRLYLQERLDDLRGQIQDRFEALRDDMRERFEEHSRAGAHPEVYELLFERTKGKERK